MKCNVSFFVIDGVKAGMYMQQRICNSVFLLQAAQFPDTGCCMTALDSSSLPQPS